VGGIGFDFLENQGQKLGNSVNGMGGDCRRELLIRRTRVIKKSSVHRKVFSRRRSSLVRRRAYKGGGGWLREWVERVAHEAEGKALSARRLSYTIGPKG